MPIEELLTISEISREDFGSLCICAVRYCLGRKTYMPSNIQRIVSANIKYISDIDLNVIYADIIKHGGPTHDIDAYGNYTNYKDWYDFFNTIKNEINRRDEEVYE